MDAAAEAGIELLAGTTSLLLAAEHKATEDYIRSSGVPFAFLRNSWYLENYAEQLPVTLQHGVLLGSAGDGRVSAASRADYADAAAAVLAADGQAGRVCELGCDNPFTMAEYVAEVSRQTGKTVVYQDLPVGEYAKALAGFGLPEPLAAVVADSDAGVARGELLVTTGDLSRLTALTRTPDQEQVHGAASEVRT